jgi:hypothetical protein
VNRLINEFQGILGFLFEGTPLGKDKYEQQEQEFGFTAHRSLLSAHWR